MSTTNLHTLIRVGISAIGMTPVESQLSEMALINTLPSFVREQVMVMNLKPVASKISESAKGVG